MEYLIDCRIQLNPLMIVCFCVLQYLLPILVSVIVSIGDDDLNVPVCSSHVKLECSGTSEEGPIWDQALAVHYSEVVCFQG